MLEAEIDKGGKQALLPMLHTTGASISGLMLLSGDLVLKVERDDSTVQLRIKNGRLFDETCGLVLRLPMDLRLPARLSQSLEMWNIATSEQINNKYCRNSTDYNELLLILDGVLTGKSQRQIAINLYGKAEIDAEWYDGSAIRGRVRRRIHKSLYLMNGGYRDLLIGGG